MEKPFAEAIASDTAFTGVPTPSESGDAPFAEIRTVRSGALALSAPQRIELAALKVLLTHRGYEPFVHPLAAELVAVIKEPRRKVKIPEISAVSLKVE